MQGERTARAPWHLLLKAELPDTEGEGRSESPGGRTTLTGTRQGSAITDPRPDVLANTGRVNSRTSAAESLIHTENNTPPQEGLPRMSAIQLRQMHRRR